MDWRKKASRQPVQKKKSGFKVERIKKEGSLRKKWSAHLKSSVKRGKIESFIVVDEKRGNHPRLLERKKERKGLHLRG